MKVNINANGGWLRLRWQYRGQRFGFYLGMRDDPIGRLMASQRAAQIAGDIATGNFDPSLLKYRPLTTGKNPTLISVPGLFEKFTAHKARHEGVSTASIKSRYAPLLANLKNNLDVPANQVTASHAQRFKALLLGQVTPQTAKERLWLLKSCWDWARGKVHLAESNPWDGLTDGIKPTPRQGVKVFTTEEIQAILATLEGNYHYPLIYFLLCTGCRFGEAAGLRWRHVVGADFQSIWIGESLGRERKTKPTKTGKDRTIALSPGVVTMLQTLHRERNPKPDSLIFPSPTGKPLDDHNFSYRIWRKTLEAAGVEYRKLYALRHSAISHALTNGADPLSVAEQAGHDPKTMFKNYAHAIKKSPVFPSF